MPIKDYAAERKRTSALIQESEIIHERNKELLREYERDKVLDTMKEPTILRNLSKMKAVAKHVEDQPFDEMDKADLKDIVEWLMTEYDKDGTIDTYKKAIRSFWTWLAGGETPDEVEWIKQKNTSASDILPKDLLTKDEIERQVAATKNPRDAALIWLLYETGGRIGELIDLTVGDIEDRQHGRKIVIDGKTGPRRLPLVESVPHLNRWLNAHPDPAKDAPLWCKIRGGDSVEKIGYGNIRKLLSNAMEDAGIDKRSNPHHYRHSRASHMANHLKEAQLCEWFGWKQGSDMPAKYVHLSGRDLDNVYDEMHGLATPEDDDDEPQIAECPRCDELNDPSAAYCIRCGYALRGESAADFEETVTNDVKEDLAETDPEDTETRDRLNTFDELMDDPAIKAALLDRIEADQ